MAQVFVDTRKRNNIDALNFINELHLNRAFIDKTQNNEYLIELILMI
jgi:hypothetical protein